MTDVRENKAEYESGEELNACIAERVMKWKISHIQEEWSYGVGGGCRKWSVSFPYKEWKYNTDGDNWRDQSSWSPSIDIKDTLEVIDKIIRDSSWEILIGNESTLTGIAWWCKMTNSLTAIFVKEQADTIPLAVCRAAMETRKKINPFTGESYG